MPCECNIIFDNNKCGEIFYSGQTLSGIASVVVPKAKMIKGIHVIIKGYTKVKWNEGQFKICEEDRNYLGKQIYLRGNQDAPPFELPAGNYELPFQFRLPKNLPSSVKTKHGRTNYNIILTVVNPVTLNNVFIKSFRVEYPLDLNSNPSYKLPIKHILQCNSWWSPYGPQIITAKFNTKTTGFQIGKRLEYELIIENDTMYDCKNVVVKLRQFITHIVKEDTIVLKNSIADKSLGAVRKLSIQKYKNVIDIPNTQSSSIDTCDILEISYKVQITVVTPSLHEDLMTVVPIVLGVVPIEVNLTDTVDVLDTRL